MPDKHIEDGLISVIMSTYNTSPLYLKQSIESILRQTYSNFEFIIIDDGSGGGIKELVEAFDDPRILFLVNERNMGLAQSLNRGLDVCRGESIARMDDDDIAYPTRFQKQIAYMREHPDVIVCGTWVEIIDEDGTPTGERICCQINDMDEYRIHLLFGNRPTIFHPSAFINRRLFLKYNFCYDPIIRYAQDYRLWVECSCVGKCSILPQILLKYRNHSKSISSSKSSERNKFDYQIIQRQLDDLHLILPDELKQLHFHLLTDGKVYDKRIKKWLKLIIKANGRYAIYNQKKLKRMVWNRWRIICQSAIKLRPGFRKSVSIMLSITPRGFMYGMKSIIKKISRRYSNPNNQQDTKHDLNQPMQSDG